MAYNRCMINHPLPEPIYVANEHAFMDMLNELRSAKQIAVDTESNSLYAYQEEVCLIQFSTQTKDYLLDPLSGVDISPLGEIFKSPEIEKIFHAAEYDIICLRRDFNFEFNNLFDSMLASRVLGFSKLGLSSLLEQYFDVHVNKRYQKANWGKRPLSDDMLNYARLDTHFLIPLRKILYKELQEKGRLIIAEEDFERISHAEATPNHKPCYSNVRGYHKLSPQQLAILVELCAYRERVAFHANIPPFKILSSKVLLETAKQAPENMEALAQVPGLSTKLLRRHATGLLQAVRLGQENPPILLEHKPKPSEAYIKRLDRLKRWRHERALLKGVESDVILSRDILEEIAKVNPQTKEDLFEVMKNTPERFRIYHKLILEILRKE